MCGMPGVTQVFKKKRGKEKRREREREGRRKHTQTYGLQQWAFSLEFSLLPSCYVAVGLAVGSSLLVA